MRLSALGCRTQSSVGGELLLKIFYLLIFFLSQPPHLDRPLTTSLNTMQTGQSPATVRKQTLICLIIHSGYERPLQLHLVQIKFGTATYDQIEQDIRVTLEAQVSLIGKTLGLISGFSIPSGVEIFYFLAKICWAKSRAYLALCLARKQ